MTLQHQLDAGTPNGLAPRIEFPIGSGTGKRSFLASKHYRTLMRDLTAKATGEAYEEWPMNFETSTFRLVSYHCFELGPLKEEICPPSPLSSGVQTYS